MSPSSTRPDNAPVGATRVVEPRGHRRWLAILLLALLAVLGLSLLLSRCGGSDDAPRAATTSPSVGASNTATPSEGSTATATTATAEPSPTGDAGAAGAGSGAGGGAGGGAGAGAATGTVVVGGNDVVLGPDGVKDLTAAASGTEAVGRKVAVQSVPADEGFWVGSGAADRVWVQLTGKAGESPYQVKVGDQVDFTGTLTDTPAGFADQVGVTADEGADQLGAQKRHVVVNEKDLKLAK